MVVPGNNNESERTLRSPAQARDTGHTNKALPGARRETVIVSVLESLRLHRALVGKDPAAVLPQFVDRGDELLSLLRPSCDFREEVYGLTLTPAEIEFRRRVRRSARVSYLFRDTPSSRLAVSILPAVDPLARVSERDWPSMGERLLAFEVNPEALRAAKRALDPSGNQSAQSLPACATPPDPSRFALAVDEQVRASRRLMQDLGRESGAVGRRTGGRTSRGEFVAAFSLGLRYDLDGKEPGLGSRHQSVRSALG